MNVSSKKQKVLFLCTANSARSQLAEAYLKKLSGDQFEVYSAGLEPKGIHPLVDQVLKEDAMDISDQTSKSVNEYLGKVTFQYVITVCENAEKNCPTIYPFALNRLFWPFRDPSACTGTEEEKLEEFRKVRDQIKRKIGSWIQTFALPVK